MNIGALLQIRMILILVKNRMLSLGVLQNSLAGKLKRGFKNTDKYVYLYFEGHSPPTSSSIQMRVQVPIGF